MSIDARLADRDVSSLMAAAIMTPSHPIGTNVGDEVRARLEGALSPIIPYSSCTARATIASARRAGDCHRRNFGRSGSGEGRPDRPPAATGWPGALPPEQRVWDELVTMLRDATTRLPETGAVERYRPRLSLDYVGQPYVGVGQG